MTSNFVDYVKIFCRSGKGGHGSLHFRREKYIPKGGPDGGKWIGKSSGSMRDLTIPLNENLLFPLSGSYHFEIEQAMRDPVLKGISDIGLYIEKQ